MAQMGRKPLRRRPQPRQQAAIPMARPAAAEQNRFPTENDLYDFTYAYPQTAGSIGGLRTILNRRLEEELSGLKQTAREAREAAVADGYPYRTHSLSVEWKVVADLPDFLSLTGDFADLYRRRAWPLWQAGAGVGQAGGN